jgi:vesicle transport through interaction with t-SNAREs 1
MEHTPATLFDAYDADYQHLISSIKTKLDVEIKNQQGGKCLSLSCCLLSQVEQRKATLRRVEIELDEADDIV